MRARSNDDLAVVASDGLTTLEYAIPAEVFGLDRPELDHFYTMTVCAAEPGTLRGAFRATVRTDGGLDEIARAGTAVVPGWRDRFERPPEPLPDALRACHDAGGRVVSICSGAFVLAAAGLLDSRRATKHWLCVDDLRRAAATVARRLVVRPHRDGGQAQHVAAPVPTAADDDIGALLSWVEADLAAAHTVASLAARLHCSPRTFARRFAAAAGTSPGRWLVARRVARVRELLESTDRSVEQVAADVGFGAAVSLRHHFRRSLRTTPTAYRRRWARTADAA